MSTKLLIVEDESFVRFYYKEVLAELGCEIDEAEDGWEAVEKLEKNIYDVALLDMNMPILTGLEVLQRIKDKNLKTKIIAISAYGMKDKIDKAQEFGAVDYLKKPIDNEELKLKIEKWSK